MAKPTLPIIRAIRNTADKLEKASNYQWGHMGACNCGFLAQVVTRRCPKEIHAFALLGNGDWSEQLKDYCPSTGMGMDQVISELLEFGFDREDLCHLERLSDPAVLCRFPHRGIQLKHNSKADVLAYLKAWAALLEDQLIANLPYSTRLLLRGEFSLEV